MRATPKEIRADLEDSRGLFRRQQTVTVGHRAVIFVMAIGRRHTRG